MNPQLTQALRLLQSGAALQAAHVARGLLSRRPDDPHALQILGIALRQLGNLDEAESRLRRSVELAPRNAEFRTNLAQLLGARGDTAGARGEFERALQLNPQLQPALRGLAQLCSRLPDHPQAERCARSLIALNGQDAEAWFLLGAALHGAGRLDEARVALERGAAIAPNHAPTRAQLAATLCDLEQAERALAESDVALRLGADSRLLTLARARSLMQLDRYDEAEALLAALVEGQPDDTESQFLLAQARHVSGDPDFAGALRTAATRAQASPATRAAYADVLRRAGNLPAAEQTVRALIADVGPSPELLGALGTILQETGRYAEALDLSRQTMSARPEDVTSAENFVAAALCAGDGVLALSTVERFAARMPTDQRWITYRADIARQTGGDLFSQWCDPARMVRSYDIEAPAGYRTLQEFTAALQDALQTRHRQRGHPLDQSLRQGTQTSRGLLGDSDPAIRAFLQAMQNCVADYQAAMPADAAHPLFRRNVAPARLVGCWSVCLRRGGFHVNHIHPQGWISSAYYVSVPAEVNDAAARSGWLKFGESRFAAPACEATHFVQPRPGRLVLFPSYLWHGTVPIHGEQPRLTIAFDAAPAAPAQSP